MAPTVAVFGGGVAGLTAAQELAIRGFDVTIYEAKDRFGGKARSFPVEIAASGQPSVPGEHGFRFFPGFYWHLIDTMERIPTENGSVADNLVSTGETLITSTTAPDTFESTRTPTTPSEWVDVLTPAQLADVSRREAAFFSERMLEFLTSCRERRERELENVSWWDYIEADRMSDRYKTHVARSTQSHVALSPKRASARSMGHISVQLVRGHLDPRLDAERILNGPTSDVWIDPWISVLEALGVELETGVSLQQFHVDGGTIRGATVERDGSRSRVTADYYVAAVPLQVMAQLADDPLRHAAPSLKGLDALETDWMNGVMFYLAEDVAISGGHQLYVDAPWALTSISQQQFWEYDVRDRSDGAVAGVLSVIISDWHTPGIVYDRPARECTPDEIREEVWAQLTDHLDPNGHGELHEDLIVDWTLDPAIEPREDGAGVTNDDPLFVNTVGSLRHRPTADTEISNFVLAGDYVRTNTDLASMESANEAARRAVNAIVADADVATEYCEVREFPEPSVFEPLKMNDRLQYDLGFPHPGAARRSIVQLIRQSTRL